MIMLVLYQWYANMWFYIRLGHCICEKIEIKWGTKQGGLTSPLLFNLFYRDLVEILQASKVGVTVSSKRYNRICYADDILLCSTTPTGLQDLINTANKYINENGLCFNPSKTSCLLVGKTLLPKCQDG